MGKHTSPRSLKPEQVELLIDDALNGRHMVESAKKLGFISRYTLWDFLRRNPDINDQLKLARFESCMFLEDDLLNIHVLEPDAKMARVRSDNLVKVLAFRNPATYSQRLDLNLNQNISMKLNIEGANTRIIEMVKASEPLALVSNPQY